MNYRNPRLDRIARKTKGGQPSAQTKKTSNAEQIELLNRLTRYPSLAALLVSGVALASVAVHLIR